MKKCALFFLMICSLGARAQDFKISGTVVSEGENEPMPGVSILELGTGSGTVTDIDGNYSLTVSDPNGKLKFSFIGYLPQVIDIGNRSEISVSLELDVEVLEDIVVVGYATQKKENLTGAVSAVGADLIEKRPVLNAAEAIQGSVPGVSIANSNGGPGSAPSIRIRGVNTLAGDGANDPLIIVDGAPVSGMSAVDPNNIKSVSVLKDASSLAIYGSRAAGGVVLITTKRGSAGDLKVTYDGYVGIQRVIDLPEFLGAEDYVRYMEEALTNELNESGVPFEDREPGVFAQPYDPNTDTDWVDEILRDNPIRQQHAVSLSAGGENASTRVTMTFQEQQGLVSNSGFKRYSLRANNDFNWGDRTKFKFDVTTKRSIKNASGNSLDSDDQRFNSRIYVGDRQAFNQAFRIPPIYRAINDDGTYGEGWAKQLNPVGMVDASGFREQTEDLVLLNLGANVEVADGLNLSYTFSPFVENIRYKHMLNRYEMIQYLGDTINSTGESETQDILTQRDWVNYTWTSTFLANYQKEFGSNSLNLLGGIESVKEQHQRSKSQRIGYLFPQYSVLNQGDQANQINSGDLFEVSLQSFFGRLGYDYDDKYFVELNARYDGSSRFAPGNQWGFFPSASVGWRLSQEEFFQVGLVDELKLRGSYGQIGNQYVRGKRINTQSFYPYLSLVTASSVPGINNDEVAGAAAVEVRANPDLTWETTSVANIGVDFSLLEGAIFGSFDYYYKETEDILLLRPVRSSLGLEPAPVNAGVVENKGWDLELGYKNSIGDLNFNVTGVLSDVRNKVVDLGGIPNAPNAFNQINQVGAEAGSLFGYKADGLLTQEDIDNGIATLAGAKEGDIKYVDQLTVDTNGDGVADAGDGLINDEDRVIIGSRIPRYSYGINISANYKGFDFSMFMNGVGKYNGYLNGFAAWAFNNTSGKITREQADNRWDPANPDPNAGYPRLWQNTGSVNEATSSFWVTDASYFKVRNIVLGYTLPESVVSRIGMERLRVYVSGQNVFNFDKIKGFDAEVPLGGGDLYPQSSVYVLGVNASF